MNSRLKFEWMQPLTSVAHLQSTGQSWICHTSRRSTFPPPFPAWCTSPHSPHLSRPPGLYCWVLLLPSWWPGPWGSCWCPPRSTRHPPCGSLSSSTWAAWAASCWGVRSPAGSGWPPCPCSDPGTTVWPISSPWWCSSRSRTSPQRRPSTCTTLVGKDRYIVIIQVNIYRVK